MSYPYRPQPKRGSRPVGRILLLALVGVALVGLGCGLGWLIFGHEPGPGAPEPRPPVAETTPDSQPSGPVTTPTAKPPATPLATPRPATDTPTPASPDVTNPSPVSSEAGSYLPPRWSELLAQALELVNTSRMQAGLQPVAWDETAARLAQAHAEDMLAGEYFSHWNRDGYGPDLRAALTMGMTDAVFENIHRTWSRFDDGTPAPIDDWPQRVLEAHQGLMESPGHRANILGPAHTHVGIGIAYRADIGELRLVQEFVNRYVELDALPRELPIGAEVEISGRLLNGAIEPLVNLAHEPIPAPLSRTDLDQTNTYSSTAEFFSAPRMVIDADRFRTRAILDRAGQPGFYHIYIFVTVNGQEVLAAAPLVVVN